MNRKLWALWAATALLLLVTSPLVTAANVSGKGTFRLNNLTINADDPGAGSQAGSVAGPFGDAECKCRRTNWLGICEFWSASGEFQSRHSNTRWVGANSRLDIAGSKTLVWPYEAQHSGALKFDCTIKFTASFEAAKAKAELWAKDGYAAISGSASGFTRVAVSPPIGGASFGIPLTDISTSGSGSLNGGIKTFTISYAGNAVKGTQLCSGSCLTASMNSIV